MLGTDHQHSHMFSYMSPEARALREKTIRCVRLSLWPETGFAEIRGRGALRNNTFPQQDIWTFPKRRTRR
jgi:hypothetical protein